MADVLNIDVATLKAWARIGGGVLLVAGIATSFFNAVPAGFLYVTGLGLLAATFLDPTNVTAWKFSGAGFEASVEVAKREIDEKVQDAKGVLAEIRAIQERLVRAQLSAVKLGGGAFASPDVDTGRFESFDAIKSFESKDDDLMADIVEQKRLLGLKFVYKLIGYERLGQHNTNERPLKLVEALTPDFHLPTPARLEELATSDGLDVAGNRPLLDAYARFFALNEMPPRSIIRSFSGE